MPDNQNPTSPAAGQGTDSGNPVEPKLIAGKFKTVEEAIEKGYGGLEQGFHDLNQKVSGLVRIMEAAIAPNPSTPIGQAGQRVDPYGRGAPASDDRIDPAAFITDPTTHLQRREEALLGKVVRIVTDVVTGAQAVSDFKTRNPDLIEHERIVEVFMKEVDSRLPVSERLNEAGKLTRNYLAKISGKQTNQPTAPRGNGFIEPPSSAANPIANSNNNPSNPSEEEELLEYINERNRDMAAHFGGPMKKE